MTYTSAYFDSPTKEMTDLTWLSTVVEASSVATMMYGDSVLWSSGGAGSEIDLCLNWALDLAGTQTTYDKVFSAIEPATADLSVTVPVICDYELCEDSAIQLLGLGNLDPVHETTELFLNYTVTKEQVTIDLPVISSFCEGNPI